MDEKITLIYTDLYTYMMMMPWTHALCLYGFWPTPLCMYFMDPLLKRMMLMMLC